MGETSGNVPCIDGQKQEKGAFTWHDTLVIQPSIALIAVLFSLSGISSRKKATRNPRVSCRRCGVAVLFISSYLKLLDCYFKIGLCTDKRTSSKKKETRNPVALQKLGFFLFHSEEICTLITPRCHYYRVVLKGGKLIKNTFSVIKIPLSIQFCLFLFLLL